MITIKKQNSKLKYVDDNFVKTNGNIRKLNNNFNMQNVHIKNKMILNVNTHTYTHTLNNYKI